MLWSETGLSPDTPLGTAPRALRHRSAADFQAGRTVEVDGWVIARCEAALSQLIALRLGGLC